MERKLISILTKETEQLRVQYLNETEIWAAHDHKTAKETVSWHEVDWCKFFGIEPTPVNVGKPTEFLSFPKGFYGTHHAKILRNMKAKAIRVARMKLNEYVAYRLDNAQQHYENSIIKLAGRIEKKNLNMGKLVVKTSCIGVNIETILTDGVQTVKAFTIIASGPVQAPHYRYLIK